MIYFLLTADSFRESALDEIGRISEYRIVDEHKNILIAEMKARSDKELYSAIFVYGCFPILASGTLEKEDYIGSIYVQVKKLGLGKYGSIKLECFDINCRNGYSAKDIEVAVGQKLEEDGLMVDINNPETLAYAILLNSKCYAGFVKLGDGRRKVIDTFRIYKEKEISRSEFKLVEAFETFRPPLPKMAIDLGAAPGGWSLFLAKSGASVIAVDNGELEYGKIVSAGIKANAIRDMDGFVIPENLKPRSIVHLKCGFQKAEGCFRDGMADMLTIDINTGGIMSSGAVLRYSRFMKKGAYLIMTVKCIMRNVGKYMEEVENELGGEFMIVQWKVLPHNRQEVTLFARKR